MKRWHWLGLILIMVVGIAATGTHGPFAIRDDAPSLTFTDQTGGEDDFDILVDGSGMSFRNMGVGGGSLDYAVNLPDTAGTLALEGVVGDHTLDSSPHTDVDTITETNGHGLLYGTAGNKWGGSDIATQIELDAVISDVSTNSAAISTNASDISTITHPVGTLPLRAQWFEPATADDDIILTIDAATAETITAIICYSFGGTTTITVSNGSGFASTNVTDAGGLVCATDAKTTDSTLTNTTISTGNIIAVDTSAVASAPTRVHVEVR